MAVAVLTVLTLSGCSGESETDPATPAEGVRAPGTAGDHSGWWCVEHAVPEEECSICSSKAAAEFKAKGDWCDEHNRAQSQCFRCDPARADKFAKLYEAKYGHEPAEATD